MSKDSKLNRLLEFALDEDWVNDVGIEGAVTSNREIEAALGDFIQSRDKDIRKN